MTTLRPTTLRRLAPAFALALFALAADARAQEPEAEAPAPQESLAPTGAGTAGKIAKWTTATNLGNSVLTESAFRVGVNVSPPAARLHVFGAPPPALATNGTNATPLLLTAGGKGGNTTGTTGQRAGAGANIYLTAGIGGDAPSGGVGGGGGSIILQPGAHGAGADFNLPEPLDGKVLLAPSGVGVVGVGTNYPDRYFSLSVDGGSRNAVYAHTLSGKGVLGYSRFGIGVYGSTYNGYAGVFEGKVQINGNLQVASCAGCTTAPSDRALKANVSAVDPRSVLDRLAALPIRTWSYKSDSPSVRHLGPMAQDFRRAFNLGKDDKHIDMVDANGVTMAAVQALYQLMLEKDRKIESLTRKVERQQAQLNQVRRAVRSGRARR